MSFLGSNNFSYLPTVLRFQSKLFIIGPRPFCSTFVSNPICMLSALFFFFLKLLFLLSATGPFFHLLIKHLLASYTGQALCLRIECEAINRSWNLSLTFHTVSQDRLGYAAITNLAWNLIVLTQQSFITCEDPYQLWVFRGLLSSIQGAQAYSYTSWNSLWVGHCDRGERLDGPLPVSAQKWPVSLLLIFHYPELVRWSHVTARGGWIL